MLGGMWVLRKRLLFYENSLKGGSFQKGFWEQTVMEEDIGRMAGERLVQGARNN